MFYFTVEFVIIGVLLSPVLFYLKLMIIRIIFVNWDVQFCLWAVGFMVHRVNMTQFSKHG